ncbi:hypothetical protein [Solilutibacter pythonis]|uniref:hypothetical protein n=1 Tax=Solilutibacter pythonis TaxID=2483112 RepID=UPI0011C4812E|nr:hypothetical protein [Lysobacter pythonis]
MKATSPILLLFAIGSFTALPARAQDSATDEALDKELLERQIAHNAAPIKSEPELRQYIASGKGNARPLSYLSESARKRFIKSLVFTERGLASFDYWDLRAELTAAQAYEVLSLFGAQRSTGPIPNLRIVNERDAAISE